MTEEERTAFNKDKKNYATIPFKLKPTKGWATPFITGHKYRFSFG